MTIEVLVLSRRFVVASNSSFTSKRLQISIDGPLAMSLSLTKPSPTTGVAYGALILLALPGGWPGAFIAQQLFHHKTKKRSFQIVFWAAVLLNCVGLVLLFGLLKP